MKIRDWIIFVSLLGQLTTCAGSETRNTWIALLFIEDTHKLIETQIFLPAKVIYSVPIIPSIASYHHLFVGLLFYD